MRTLVTAVMLTALLGGCATMPPSAGYEAASVSSAPVGKWQGTAAEFQGTYLGTPTARVSLDLKPDGTWSETWTEGSRAASDSGRWRINGNAIVLESSGRTHPRLTLRRRNDALYTVAVEPLLSGRTTTMTIELHPTGP